MRGIIEILPPQASECGLCWPCPDKSTANPQCAERAYLHLSTAFRVFLTQCHERTLHEVPSRYGRDVVRSACRTFGEPVIDRGANGGWGEAELSATSRSKYPLLQIPHSRDCTAWLG